MNGDRSLPLGQHQARTRWGTHESGAAFDRKKSCSLTEQAQAFLAQQAVCVLAGRGTRHELEAQLVMEQPGFIDIVDPQTCVLHLNARERTSPLLQSWQHASADGLSAQVGLFCLCHPTRERLCVHGTVHQMVCEPFPLFWPFQKERSISVRLHVEQAFFHCAKYIRTRVAGLTTPVASWAGQRWHPQGLLSGTPDRLWEEMRAFVAQHVLCFLCTVSQQGQCAVNHRGGAPGFLRTVPPTPASPGGTVLLPDYAGNGAFEAIGNILETGLATVLVPDYAAHLAVCLGGTARVYEVGELPAWLAQQCPGAERVVALSVQRISVQHGDWSTTLAYERLRAQAVGTTTDAAMAGPV